VAADIQQCAHLAVLAADYQERLPAQAGGEKIAGLTNLTLMPDAMPVAQDQPPYFLLEELLIAIELAAEGVARALGRDCLRAPVRAR
jgi:hypothetical protein